MNESCEPRLALQAALPVQAERGGKPVPGCAPFGLQRTVCAPRSIHAGVGRRDDMRAFAAHRLQGTGGLFFMLGAASGWSFLSPLAPNPAFKRTCRGRAA
jgi:hypothetical protein